MKMQRCVKIDPWTKEITEVQVEYTFVQDELVHPLGPRDFDMLVHDVLENGDILVSGRIYAPPRFTLGEHHVSGIGMLIAEGGAKSLLVEVQDAVKWQ